MKTLVSAVLVLVVAASSFGAMVTLTPTTPTSVVGPSTGTVKYDVTISSADVFNGFDLTLATDATNTANKLTFAYATNFVTDSVGQTYGWDIKGSSANATAPGARSGMAKEIYTFGALTSSDSDNGATLYAGPSLKIGTLTVPLTGLANGDYHIYVIGGLTGDGIGKDGAVDTFTSTSAAFSVTPEPATMALLALGGLLVARRRHA